MDSGTADGEASEIHPGINGSKTFSADACSAQSVSTSKTKTPSPGAVDVSSKISKKTLACLPCRFKKIKCKGTLGSCTPCVRMGLRCVVPALDERKRRISSSSTCELQMRVIELETALHAAQQSLAEKEELLSASKESQSLVVADGTGEIYAPAPGSLVDSALKLAIEPSPIARMFNGFSHFNKDLHTPDFRFFGPTSSLHKDEGILGNQSMSSLSTKRLFDNGEDLIPLRLQAYLLEKYWQFQHGVLPVIHKTAFLEDYASGEGRYCSKALLYCLFVCGARLSENAEVRALAFSVDENTSPEKEPYLMRTATKFLAEELEHPRLATIQALLVIGVIYAAKSADSRGWTDSGLAIRLMFDLGLHRDPSEISSANFSLVDIEVRRVVFWGCFTYDRAWSLYLGRPSSIKMTDVTVHPLQNETTLPLQDLQIGAAWSSLFTIIGCICDSLTCHENPQSLIETYNAQLLQWSASLKPSLWQTSQMTPGLYALHIQTSSATILVYRPAARYDRWNTNLTDEMREARKICVHEAHSIARLVQKFHTAFGSATTMVGISLYNITLATIILIADVANDTGDNFVAPSSTFALEQCIFALQELETSYVVAHTLLKQIKFVMQQLSIRPTSGFDLHAIWRADTSVHGGKDEMPDWFYSMDELLSLNPISGAHAMIPMDCRFDSLSSAMDNDSI